MDAFHVSGADVIKSLDTFDSGLLGLGWAHSSGSPPFAWSSLWLCVSLCVGYQGGLRGVTPQCCADDQTRSSYCDESLLPAAQCATALAQVVGQEVSLGGSSLDEELGDSWGWSGLSSFDIRDLGGYLDTTSSCVQSCCQGSFRSTPHCCCWCSSSWVQGQVWSCSLHVPCCWKVPVGTQTRPVSDTRKRLHVLGGIKHPPDATSCFKKLCSWNTRHQRHNGLAQYNSSDTQDPTDKQGTRHTHTL